MNKSSRWSDDTFNKLKSLLEPRSQNEVELLVKAFEKRGLIMIKFPPVHLDTRKNENVEGLQKTRSILIFLELTFSLYSTT